MNAMENGDRYTNCVLLRDDAAPRDAQLTDQLHARHWQVETTASPHQAFARLCLHERLESARSSWGLERHRPPVLVLEKMNTPNLQNELLDACDQYLSGIGIWQWADGRLTEVRAAAPPPPLPIDKRISQSGDSAPPARPTISSNNGPMLRLHEPPEDETRTDARADSETDHDSDDAPAAHDTSLSSDEVNMLLGSGEEPASS